jgi:hypothetical protein
MSTAAAKFVTGFANSPGRVRTVQHTPGLAHSVFRLDAGTFNASTNPEGIQGLTSTDTIIIAQASRADLSYPADLGETRSELILETIAFYSEATFDLGTAVNVAVKIVRGSNSSLPGVTLGTITKASGFFTATKTGLSDLDVVLQTGDKLVIVPNAAIDTAQAATNDLFLEITFKRLITGGRLTEGTAVA